MIITCSKCGHINDIGAVKLNRPVISTRCKKCGSIESIEIGAFSQSAEKSGDSGQYGIPYDGRGTEEEPHYEESQEIPPGAVLKGRFMRIVALVALMIFFAMAVPYLGNVFFHMKSSGAYKAAEGFVRNNPEIKAQVGGDIVKLKPVRSRFTQVNDNDRAQLGFRVSGTKGTTDVIVYLAKVDGAWKITSALYRDRYGKGRQLRGAE